jgi:uncharacterized protein YbcI
MEVAEKAGRFGVGGKVIWSPPRQGVARSPALSERDFAAEISDLVGGLAAEYTGPGSRARTYVSDEVITVVLKDTLTEGERRLVRDGMSDLVLSTRMAFQQTMREDLIAGIEEITGRNVSVRASEMMLDIGVETLVLACSARGDGVRAGRRDAAL